MSYHTRILIILCLTLGFSTFLACNRSDAPRKIRLADGNVTNSDARLSTTIYLEEQQRRSMAVWFFQNETGDENLEWLRKGLTEMFIRALSQSRSLSVMGTDRLYEIAGRLGEDVASEQMDMEMAAIFAQEANVEALLTGNISKRGDSLQINISLHEPEQGIVLSKESIEGPGLENLFAMVDQLTQKLKQDLNLAMEKQPERSLADLSTSSLQAWRHYTAGMDLQNQVLTTEAVREFQKAIQIDSAFVSAHHRLAMAYFGLGDTQKAIRSYQKAQSLKSKATVQEMLQIDLIEALLKSDDETMLAIHDKMQAVDPNNIEASYTLANYYFGYRRYDEAVKYYQEILETDPKHKMSFNQIGYSRAFIGDFEGAKEAFQKYIEVAPDEPNPYDSIGEICWIRGDYKQAEKYFRTALEKNRAFTAGWGHLGQIYLEQGNCKKALKVFQTMLDMETERAPKAAASYFMGITATRMNQDDKAIAYFLNAIELLETSDGAIDRLVEIYKNRQEEETADQFLMDQYKRLLKNLESGDQSIEQVVTLAHLSLDYHVFPEKTLMITQKVSEEMELFNFRLIAALIETLLKFQLQQPVPIESLASGIDYQELPRVMKGMGNFGYVSFWKYFNRINQYYYNHPEEGDHFYMYMIELCADEDLQPERIAFQMLLSDLYLTAGRTGDAEVLWRQAGIPDESFWRVIGTFENRNGFGKVFPPERKIDFAESCKVSGRQIGWQTHSDSLWDGFINLKKNFTESDWAVAYAVVDVISETDQQAWIRIGATDAVKVWVNDVEVWRFNRIREARIDEDNIRIHLESGHNRILIKTCNLLSDWGFYFRITDEAGKAIPDLRFASPAEDKQIALIPD
jgi:tetratricopeptide (TPR) repeat protein